MKKIKIASIICLFSFLTVFNFLQKNNLSFNDSDFSLKTLSIKSAVAGEIGEITITCDSGGWGQCYEEHWLYGIFHCVANGDPNSFCF